MAEEKKLARTMRSDPPASPTEVLRTVNRGCVESIRVRKGAPDDLSLELPDPDGLNPSTESALEFKGEIAGAAQYKSPAAPGEFLPLEGTPEAETMSALMDTPSPMLMSQGGDFQAFASVSDMPLEKALRASRPAPKVKRSTLDAMLEEIQEMIAGAEQEKPVQTQEEFFRIQREASKRIPEERLGSVLSISKVRAVLISRLKRFYGVPMTRLARETLKAEIDQYVAELKALGWID